MVKNLEVYSLIIMNNSSSNDAFYGVNVSSEYDLLAYKQFLDQVLKTARINRILVPTVIIVLLVIGAVGNVLVLVVSVRSRRISQNSVHSWFVVNIAVADLIYLIINPPYYIESNINSEWNYPPFYCPLKGFLSNLTVSAGITSMCILAWMRCQGARSPMKFQQKYLSSKKFGFAAIAGAWLCALAYAMPCAIYVRHNDDRDCIWTSPATEDVYKFVSLAVTYICPSGFVILFYALIRRAVKKMQTRNVLQPVAEKLIHRTVFVLISAFLILWFPTHLYNLIIISKVYEDSSHYLKRHILQTLSECMSYAHACINPIIYTFAMPTFRNHLMQDLKVFWNKMNKLHGCCFRQPTDDDQWENNDTYVPMLQMTTRPAASKTDTLSLSKSRISVKDES